MNRAQRTALISPVVAALLGVAAFGSMPAGSFARGCGSEPVAGATGVSSAVAEGAGIAAVVGDQIVAIEGAENRRAYAPASVGKGVLRHIASAPQVGTAYVSDEYGPDILITVGPEGVSEIFASGEVTHPALSASGDLVWAEDFEALRISAPGREPGRTIARPPGSTAVFSPVFISATELMAVVQEPVVGYSGEDDTLNNLYRYDLMADTWTRITAFQATAENWSVLRTPVVARDGSVFFVRIEGAASQTRPPTFELWSRRAGSVSKVRDLPKEMFLAGVTDQGLLWNIYDGTEWRLFQESRLGLLDLGCGAVQVDPRAQPDLDIPKEDPASDRRRSRDRAGAEAGSAGVMDAEMAILVGDFSTRQQAEAVANRLGVTGLEIVTNRVAPVAIAPGKWGVVKRLPADADLTLAIEDFRRAFPDYAGRSWVVSLAGGISAG